MTDIVKIGPAGAQPLPDQPDAHGQAALMLAESILHALVDAGTFTIEEAIEVVATAQDAKEERGKETSEKPERISQSLHLLGQIATSFNTDLRE